MSCCFVYAMHFEMCQAEGISPGTRWSSDLPVQNTFIHFYGECESDPDMGVEYSVHPRGSQTLSPVLLPRSRRCVKAGTGSSPCEVIELVPSVCVVEGDTGGSVCGSKACLGDPATPIHKRSSLQQERCPQTPERPSKHLSGLEALAVPQLPKWADFEDEDHDGQHAVVAAAGAVVEGACWQRSVCLPAVRGLQMGQHEWIPLSSFGGGQLEGLMFRFSLRRADNGKLGLEVERTMNDRALLVHGVLGGCVLEAWNKQCHDGEQHWKAVLPGDRIVQINNALGCADMLEEINQKQLLQLVVVREGSGGKQAQLGCRHPVDGECVSCAVGGSVCGSKACLGDPATPIHKRSSLPKPVLVTGTKISADVEVVCVYGSPRDGYALNKCRWAGGDLLVAVVWASPALGGTTATMLVLLVQHGMLAEGLETAFARSAVCCVILRSCHHCFMCWQMRGQRLITLARWISRGGVTTATTTISITY